MSNDVTTTNERVPTSVSLGPSTTLDLSHYSDDERKALLTDYTKGMLDVSKKASELNVDVGTLRNTLEGLSDHAKRASTDGNSFTATHTQTTSIGRTEIVIGNTETARAGKLSRSQTGERDWTPFYIVGGLIALALIVVAFGS